MARIYAAMMFDDETEPKERVFCTRQDAFCCLEDDSFVNLFRIPKSLAKILCNELRPDLSNLSSARTALSVETQVCDSDLKIININSKHPGRSHDAFIWKHSKLRNIFRNEHSSNGTQTSWLLGDSGYPLEPWLMTPILNPVGNSENRYNQAHARGRNVVERCKSRFRCLSKHRVLHLSPTVASRIINSCAILHNLCIKYRVEHEDIDGDDSDDLPGSFNQLRFSQAIGVRNQLIRNHFS